MLLTAFAIAAALQHTTAAAPATTVPLAVTPQHIRNGGMIGDLYRPARAGRAPALLLLGGSEGGLGKAAAAQAAALAAHGYVVLQLSYFGSPGQPYALKSIELGTFTRALDWLKKQPGGAADRVGIVGTSKGAEAALLVASRRTDLKIAVLGVPSSVVWPGIDPAGLVTESSWTTGGKPVPFTPYGWTGEWRGIHALYADALADPAKAAAGAIPAERAQAAIVMVCGEADALWPSCPMARAVETRLQAARYKHPVTVLAYQDAGHTAFGPPPVSASQTAGTAAPLGGSVAGNRTARVDGWPKILAALDAALVSGVDG
ncbi:alpha/beta hydrolase fold domain-containing protein [Sphingomonas sp. RHCKR47]|uniref:acyl-CoA thioester hydrolase/BAAT C-terminal domain-containing protein n=1 Tax=Sphingomonas citricola TaxID=2862498 RepID=UPI001CA49D0B|nr:acyl-CoA thioester hydrolase/BAAT C-terminal domain-containing protein [Sphingomonas citricola]MBW6525026.1 alpha/beta hydrolase fold domain-containing protein [Sphingomonas citricola]